MLRIANGTAISISNEPPPLLPPEGVLPHFEREIISISNEPPPLLPRHFAQAENDLFLYFNLKRAATPLATARSLAALQEPF
jgi:hypothetical protein